MKTDDWFREWVVRHTERFPRGDWPGAGSEFWAEIRRLFVTKGVTEDVADEASRLLFEDPPEFIQDLPKKLLARIRGIWNQPKPGAVPIKTRSQIEEEVYNGEWNRKAEANWSLLDESERDEWRRLAYERAPFARIAPTIQETIAIAWAYDPSSVIPLPPPEGPKPRRLGMGRLFDPTLKKKD